MTEKGAKDGTGYVDGKSKEIKTERKVNAKTFSNPDGTESAKIYAQPIHFKDDKGQLQDIDTKLVDAGKGKLQNGAGPAQIEFAESAASPELFKIKSGKGSVSMSLKGAKASKPKAKDNEVTYPEVAPGVDLQYRVGKDVVKEVVVLKKPPAAGAEVKFEFPLKLEGLTPVKTDDGGIDLNDAEGKPELRIPPGIAWDSKRDPGSDEPAYGPATIDLVQDKGGYVVVLSGNIEWLRSPERQYPVYLDPTTALIGAFRADGAGHDAFVSDAFPNNNYNQLCCSGNPGRWEDKLGYYPGAGTNHTFMYYDLNSLQNAQILSASWVGYFIHSYYPTTPTTYALRRVSTGWDQWGVKWPNQPQLGARQSTTRSAKTSGASLM